MLTSPIHDENRVVLVASKYGDDRNPQWYGNLTANPDVEILIDGQRRELRARTASADERNELCGPRSSRSTRVMGAIRRRPIAKFPWSSVSPGPRSRGMVSG